MESNSFVEKTEKSEMNPLVSIIIPVYNKCTFIKETLDSALGQTYSNIELVLVNDGSTDGSLDILKKYKTRFPEKITLIHQPNGGVSKAINTGIGASRGDYIQFLDADDLLSSDKIEKQIKLISGKGTKTIATCQWVSFKGDVYQSIKVPYNIFKDFNSGLELLLQFWNYQEMNQPAVYLTHRDLLEMAGTWNENLYINQDGEFFTRALLHVEKVLFEPSGKVYYRSPGEGNVSQQKSEKAMTSLLESYRAYECAVLKIEGSLKVRIALKKVYQKFIYDVYPNYPKLILNADDLIRRLNINFSTYIGGPKFQFISKIIGFKNALMLKRIIENK